LIDVHCFWWFDPLHTEDLLTALGTQLQSFGVVEAKDTLVIDVMTSAAQ
jgi:hypothetical protein